MESARAAAPPRPIDPARHGQLVAALGRSQELLQQLLDQAVFYAPDPQLGGLRAKAEAHLRAVRARLPG